MESPAAPIAPPGAAADPTAATDGRRPIDRRPIEVRRLGAIPYGDALALQQALVADRRAGRVPDLLLLLEHPHVITLGVAARRSRANVLASPDDLAGRGVEVREAPRGGDVTYHGPGQLVGYPILDLRPDRCDVHRYVRDLEEALIRTARAFDVGAARVAGLTGVWADGRKLASIGVRVSRWVTSHGFALNVDTDLDYFRLIRPCGLRGCDVTSLAALTGRRLSVRDVEPALAREFRRVFGRPPAPRAAY